MYGSKSSKYYFSKAVCCMNVWIEIFKILLFKGCVLHEVLKMGGKVKKLTRAL